MNWILRALAAALIAACLSLVPTSAFAKDTDGDGLPDAWERGRTPQGLNLNAMGASPRHRDIYVEMSYSRRSGKAYLPCSELDRLYREAEERFAGDEIPLPLHWGGYRLLPLALELWQGRANRFHDRARYTRTDLVWSRVRLGP